MVIRGQGVAERCVLVVPPFAEEMNKCRRQFTTTLDLLSQQGLGSLIVDLFGTGDSDGEFADASWQRWQRDVGFAIEYATSQGMVVDGVIACRLGCLLLADVCNEFGHQFRQSVLWQPVISGGQYMSQFLRLRVAAKLMQDDPKETVKELKGSLAAGNTLEVAGYDLSPGIWRSLESLDLADILTPKLGNTTVLELGRSTDGSLSIPMQKLVAAGKDMQVEIEGKRILGEPFWSSTEIVVNKELAEVTASVFSASVTQ